MTEQWGDGVVYLTAEQWVRLNERLAEPPAALPGLRELLSRVTPWGDDE